jgi:uncharacterized protein
MMRIVLDTNVLVAAFMAHGNCNELLEHCVTHHEVVLSPFILEELRAVLMRKFKYPDHVARCAVRLLGTRVSMTCPKSLPTAVCRDPDDDQIIAAAISADCHVIVTGDKDLTDLRQVNGIAIITPSEFWKFENETIRE